MDERYFAYYDEADWCSRMTESGLKSYVVPSVTIFHKGISLDSEFDLRPI